MNCISYESESQTKLPQKQNSSPESESQETKVKSISKNWESIAS